MREMQEEINYIDKNQLEILAGKIKNSIHGQKKGLHFWKIK